MNFEVQALQAFGSPAASTTPRLWIGAHPRLPRPLQEDPRWTRPEDDPQGRGLGGDTQAVAAITVGSPPAPGREAACGTTAEATRASPARVGNPRRSSPAPGTSPTSDAVPASNTGPAPSSMSGGVAGTGFWERGRAGGAVDGVGTGGHRGFSVACNTSRGNVCPVSGASEPVSHVRGLRQSGVRLLLGALGHLKGVHGLVAEAEGSQAVEVVGRVGDLNTSPLGGHHSLLRGQPGWYPGQDTQILIRREYRVVNS